MFLKAFIADFSMAIWHPKSFGQTTKKCDRVTALLENPIVTYLVSGQINLTLNKNRATTLKQARGNANDTVLTYLLGSLHTY